MKVCVIGGGASGMVAAIAAARAGADVTIMERNDRLGKKILATGNGKCNLGNRNLSIEHYYSEDLPFVSRILEQFDTDDTIRFFHSIGLLIRDKNGYLYPYSEQASSVLDVLRFEIVRLGIQVHTDCCIEKIVPWNQGGFQVWGSDQRFIFDRVILATGSKASPKTGSDGAGYRLAEALGLKLIPPIPALVQLRCRDTFWKGIAGVRTEAEIIVVRENRVLAKERGELQLTEYGISGIPTFQLSRVVNKLLLTTKEVTLLIDFMPEQSEDFFSLFFKDLKKQTKTVEEYLAGLWNKKLLYLFLKKVGIDPAERVRNVSRQALEQVYLFSRRFPVVCIGSNSFDQAQVCAGGVMLDELTDELEVKRLPGLFVTGELMDVDGKCGGYNLHWAWSTGYIAGEAAAKDS